MRRALKKITAFILAFILAAAFSGCAELTGLDAQSLMSPPKTTADREAIYALMCGDQTDVTLVYPKNGDYRSAIISRDLNGDGSLEVVSFCANSEAGGIRVQFFSKDENGTWYSMAQFVSTANQVDKLFFGDLTGDGQEEVVVGWGDPQTATASISVYRMAENAVQEFPLSTVTYSEMLLTDFDDDAVQELFVLEVAAQVSEEENTVATPLGSLYRFDSTNPYVALTVPLDTAVIRYLAASFVQVNTWRHMAVLDGVKADGRMITQIVGYDDVNEMLVSHLSNASAEEPNPTDRATAVAVTCRDINGDGVTEIPTVELVLDPGEGTADSTAYLVTWNTYSMADNKFTPVCTSILNTTENYFILLPENENKIACVNDTVTRTATFFRYSRMDYSGQPVGREELFAVTVYTEEEWKAKQEAEDSDEDIHLGSMAGRVYALHVLDGSLSADSTLIRSVTEGFKILNE